MDIRVIEVTELNNKVKFNLRGHIHYQLLVFRTIASGRPIIGPANYRLIPPQITDNQ